MVRNRFDFVMLNLPSNPVKDFYPFKLDLNKEQISLFEEYRKQIIYLTIVSESVDKKNIYWSTTFASALNN